MPSKKIDFEVVRRIALALPQVEQATIHGAPALRVRGKLLCCPAIHGSAEPDTLAVQIDIAERGKLVDADPSVYYLTDHYLKYSTVLVRLPRIDERSLELLLGTAWKFVSGTSRSSATKRDRKERKP